MIELCNKGHERIAFDVACCPLCTEMRERRADVDYWRADCKNERAWGLSVERQLAATRGVVTKLKNARDGK